MNAVGGEETVTQKRIGLFKQLVPGLTRLGLIASDVGVAALKEKDALRKVATELGFELVHHGFKTLDELEGAFAAGLRDDVSAFYISGEPLLSGNLSRVMTFVTASRKPSVGPYPDWGRAGLLIRQPTWSTVCRRRLCRENLEGCQARDLPTSRRASLRS